jgi:ketosteroid isomerase-like protein
MALAPAAATTMSTERMIDFFAAWDAHDVERIVGFFTPDGAYYASIGPDDDGTAFRGIDEVRRGVTAFLETYRRAYYTDTKLNLEGDRGVAQWTFHGTTADGKEIRYRGVDILEFVGDRIKVKDAFRKERSAPIGG